jgi:hypothetical protein
MLLDAAAALRSEQYPSMAQIAADRQRDCPGPDSLFLLGLARANMIHNGLVPRESELLVRAQAVHALSTALDSGALPGEWLQPANAWLHYLQRLERELAEAAVPPPPAPAAPPTIVPPAAPPFEPSPSHLGPLILAGAGIGLLGAGVVTTIVSGGHDPYDDTSTLDTATDVLLITGGAALVSALTWYLLTPRPSDSVQISVAPYFSTRSATASLHVTF